MKRVQFLTQYYFTFNATFTRNRYILNLTSFFINPYPLHVWSSNIFASHCNHSFNEWNPIIIFILLIVHAITLMYVFEQRGTTSGRDFTNSFVWRNHKVDYELPKGERTVWNFEKIELFLSNSIPKC